MILSQSFKFVWLFLVTLVSTSAPHLVNALQTYDRELHEKISTISSKSEKEIELTKTLFWVSKDWEVSVNKKEFYKNPDRYAFQTQLFFLLSRFKQQQILQQTDLFTNAIISDYMFVKDRIFAALNLNDKEMSLYDSVAKILEKNISNPDMVIFLQSDTDRLMQNINTRGREYEKQIDSKYIDALNQMYNEFFFRYKY